MKKTLIFTGIALALFTASCKKKGCTDLNADNFEVKAKKDNNSCTYSKYAFVDENGNSTVSFSGQTERMEMLTEMSNYLKSANTAGVALDAQTLKNMFTNSGYTWEDANGLDLNSSSKQLKDKCAGGDAEVTALFESYMDSIAALSSTTVTGVEDGTAGKGGVYPNDNVKGPYLMTAKGIEYVQWIEKGLMGAVFYNQITDVYLGDDKMNVDNSTPEEGKYYTKMEHHWDEAFGYFSYSADYPTTAGKFWSKYASDVEALIQSESKILNAFIAGRVAITQNDITARDAQITIIRDELEKLCAATAIHYLNEAIANMTKNTTRNHVLSEATAFIDALRYGYNSISGKSMSKTEINTLLDTIGKDFNNVTLSNLQSVKNSLSTEFGLDSVKDQL